jgi:hypothetical protein
MSRAKPAPRDSSVQPPTVRIERIRLIGFIRCLSWRAAGGFHILGFYGLYTR